MMRLLTFPSLWYCHLLVMMIMTFTLRSTSATISITSTMKPYVSGTYVRGVEMGHEHAYANAEHEDLWLYRNKDEPQQWIIGKNITDNVALAFKNFEEVSSIFPCNALEGGSTWIVFYDGDWHFDNSFQVVCNGIDPGGVDACSSSDTDNNNTEGGPCLTLNNGVQMPIVMLGTAYIGEQHSAGQEHPEIIETPPAIERAIDIGYRGLDIGSQIHPAYANEKLVGDLLQQRRQLVEQDGLTTTTNNSRRLRRSVFIETKLSPSEHGFNATLKAFQRSLRLLQTDTIDLYLIHHPDCISTNDSDVSNACEGHWTDSWQAITDLYQLGAVRAIGISNFDVHLLRHLLKYNNNKKNPISVIQNHVDPITAEDPMLLKLCETHGIQYQAFSVLGRQLVVGPWASYWNSPHHPVLEHPDILEIANQLNVTTAQVVLRWAVNKGWAVIPKTGDPERLEINRQLWTFNLTDADMAVMDNLPRPEFKMDNEL